MGGFRGDLSTLSLADIFQTLSNSQKEGTLVVGDGESRKCIYFGKEGLSLLSIGSRKGLRIGDLLLKAGRISSEQLKEVLATQKGSGKRLGELIVDRGLATNEDITNLIRTQIEDEIFDLFSWRKASFEFIDGPPAPELMDVDKPVTSLKFDVNSLLFEASRRIDEWQLIHQAIPSSNTIFMLTAAGEKAVQASQDPAHRSVARLVDASRTVDQIVEESNLSRFAAHKALYELFNQQGIRQVSQDELTSLGKKLSAAGDPARAIRVLTCAVDLNHDNLAPQQELALVLRQNGQQQEAYVYYMEMARIWEGRGRRQEAHQAYKQALECKPDDPAASLGLFRHLHALRLNQEAAQIGSRLFPILLQSGDRAAAREVGEALGVFAPADTEIRLRLAALCQDMGDQDACGRHLAAALDHLPPGSGTLEELSKKVLKVLPSRTDIRFKLERLHSDRRSERKRRLTRMGLIAGGCALGAVLLMFVWYEVQARRAWTTICEEAGLLMREEKWDKAKEKYLEIESRYGWSFVASQAEEKIAEVEEIRVRQADSEKRKTEEQRERDRKAEGEQRKKLSDAQKFEEASTPDLPAALRLYEAVREWGEANQKSEIAREAEGAARRLEAYLKKALALSEAADTLLKDGKVEAAHGKVRELVRECPKAPQALTAKLPFSVTSVPPGAEIAQGSTKLGKTPAVILVPALAPGEISLRLASFEVLKKALEAGTPSLSLEMVKQRAWSHALGGGIESSVCVDGGKAIVGTLDRKLWAVDLSDPKAETWKPFQIEDSSGQIQSSPVVRDGRVFFGANDGHVYCLDAKSGGLKWRYKTGGPVKGGPVVTDDGAMVLAGSSDGNLYALDVFGSLRWKAPTAKPVRSRAYCAGGRAYFGSDDGKIRAVDLSDGKEKWVLGTGGMVTGSLTTWNSLLVVGCGDDGLYVVSLDGRLEDRYSVGKPIVAGACVSGDVAFFGVPGALYARDLRQRKDAWVTPFLITKDSAIRGTPVVGDEAVYFGADDGILYAVDQKSGLLRWKYSAGGKISGSPTLFAGGDRSLILIGSSDGSLYALER